LTAPCSRFRLTSQFKKFDENREDNVSTAELTSASNTASAGDAASTEVLGIDALFAGAGSAAGAEHDTGAERTAGDEPVARRQAPRGGTSSSPAIELRQAAVRGPRGTVFGPLTVSSDRPVTVVLGSHGTGRTSLLLAIAGRMRLSEGSLVTLGATKPAEIRRRTGVVGFAEIDALEPAVTLGATLRERLAWAMPWYRRTPRMTPELTSELLARAFGDYEQPDPATLVRELTPAEEMLVRVSLALIEEPEMLAVDDLDALRDPAERALVAERLSALAADGLRIAVATSDPGDAALLAGSCDPALIEL